jgi:uncharacterized membrane protein
MKRSLFPGVIAVAVLLGVAGFVTVSSGRLPGRFAVHWDAQGVPNGWNEKAPFLKVFAGFAGFINLVFLAALVLLRRTPASMINIPYKKFWFSTPELRETAYQKLGVILFAGLTLCNLVFLLWYYLIYQEAVPDAAFKISTGAAVLGILLLAVLLQAGLIFYTRPPRTQQPSG